MPQNKFRITQSQKQASIQKLFQDLKDKRKPKQKTPLSEIIEESTRYRHAGYKLLSGAKKVNIQGINNLETVKIIKNGKGEIQGLIAKDYPRINEFITENNKINTSFHLVYYPKIKDAEIFRKASGGLKRGSPGQRFLGSVGSIRVTTMNDEKKPTYEIHFIQAHAKSGTKNSPPRALMTKYGGWRQKLLDCVFDEAQKNKATVQLLEKNPNGQNWLTNEPQEKRTSFLKSIQNRIELFEKTAKKNRFHTTKEIIDDWTVWLKANPK